MSYAALLRKHLMSIYMRMDKIEKNLSDLSDELKKQAKDFKKTGDEMGKKIDEKTSGINQQLTEIDSKLSKEDVDLRNTLENLKGELNKIEKDKLPATEFHEFVDKFVEALSEKFPAFEAEGEAFQGLPPPLEETEEQGKEPIEFAPVEGKSKGSKKQG